MEELRKDPTHNNSRVEVFHQNESKMSLKVTFRSVRELDEYLNSRFNRMLLQEASGSLSLDDLERASSEVATRLNEMNNIHGHMIIE